MLARLALLSLLCLPLAAAQAQLTIELKGFAHAQSHQVRLSEIAVLDTRSAAGLQQLGGMVVATIAHPNQPLRIEAKHLLQVITRQQPALRDRIELRGAAAVSVTLIGQDLPESDIRATAKTFLHQELARHATQLEIVDLRLTRAAGQMPAGALLLKARLNSPFKPTRNITVAVDVFVNDKRVDTIPVAATLDMTVLAYRLTRALSAGESVQASDYEIVPYRLEDSSPATVLLKADAPLFGLRLRHQLAANTLLRRNDLEPVPAVARHQHIAAELQAGGIVIEKTVIAQSDGYLGQKIKVADTQSVAVYVAKVIAPGRVEVE